MVRFYCCKSVHGRLLASSILTFAVHGSFLRCLVILGSSELGVSQKYFRTAWWYLYPPFTLAIFYCGPRTQIGRKAAKRHHSLFVNTFPNGPPWLLGLWFSFSLKYSFLVSPSLFSTQQKQSLLCLFHPPKHLAYRGWKVTECSFIHSFLHQMISEYLLCSREDPGIRNRHHFCFYNIYVLEGAKKKQTQQ